MSTWHPLLWPPDAQPRSVLLLRRLEGNAGRALLLGDANLLDGMGRERVGRRDQRGLGTVAVLISHVVDLSYCAVREGEPVEERREGGKEGIRMEVISRW